jgi:hypothetical protein
MTASTDSSLQRSPWLSVWSRPRDTIEWIIARDPRRHVILLACLGAAFNLLVFLISLGGISALLDWRVSLATAVAAVALGISGLYIYGLFLFWSGRLL